MKIMAAMFFTLCANVAYADQIEIEYPAGVFTKAGVLHKEQDDSPAMVATLEHTLPIERGKPFAVWINRLEGAPIGFCDGAISGIIWPTGESVGCWKLNLSEFVEAVSILPRNGRSSLTAMRVAVAAEDVIEAIDQGIASVLKWFVAEPTRP